MQPTIAPVGAPLAARRFPARRPPSVPQSTCRLQLWKAWEEARARQRSDLALQLLALIDAHERSDYELLQQRWRRLPAPERLRLGSPPASAAGDR